MTKNKIFWILSEILVGALVIYSLQPSLYASWNIGIWFPTIFFTLVLTAIFFREKIKALFKGKAKPLMIILTVFLALCIIFAGTLSVLMVNSFNYGEINDTTVVVLGCDVRDGEVGPMLRARLDKTYEVLTENPELKCIVTGGQGDDEPFPQGVVMKKYLVEKGINADRIFEENKAYNTYENIKFSKVIIEENNLPEKMTFVSSEYHQFRAKTLAKAQGIDSSARSCHTKFSYIFCGWVREWFGICRAMTLKY